MILARYSVKDILASAFQQAHDAVTAAYTLICFYLTDGDEGLNLRCTARRMSHSQLNATRLYQVLSCGCWDTADICSRLWQLPKLPNHARLDGGTAKDWKRDDVCSLRPFLVIRLILIFTLQMASALEDLSVADARRTIYLYGHPISCR